MAIITLKKKLRAKHYEHDDPELPKVFISELMTAEFSDSLQQKVKEMVAQIIGRRSAKTTFCIQERTGKSAMPIIWRCWKKVNTQRGCRRSVTAPTTLRLALISCRATIRSSRLMKQLKDNGFTLNTSGGEIKGSPEVYLEQSSTMANRHDVAFSDQNGEIPSCFYEFAKRYEVEDR